MPPKRKRGLPRKAKKNVGVKTKRVKAKDEIKVEFYECELCSKSVRVKDKISHTKRCDSALSNTIKGSFFSKKSAYSCSECSKKFRFKNSYEEHLKSEHSKLKDSVPCEECPVRCPDAATLQEHVEKFHKREIFSCPHCHAEFVRRSHVLRHMAQRGCDGKGITMYPCEICDAKFTRKDNLMVHLRLQHIMRNEFCCKHCDFQTKNFSRLINHWQLKHSDTPNLFQCHHCGKYTSSRAAMTKHLEIHGERKYSCDVCGYSTFTIEVMRRHVYTHLPEKPYKCSLCKQSYIQRVQLERHLEKHTGNMCLTCGLTFNSKLKLVIHQRDHMGLKKLFCPIKNCQFAQKEFSNEAALNTHIKTHFDEKKYSCEVCHKKFHSELTMRRHLPTHTLDRPRRCMYCVAARAYVRGEQLVRHVRRHHPGAFHAHLLHVRQVLGGGDSVSQERVKKSELESILNVLDAESERILENCSGTGVLYGGMQEESAAVSPPALKNEPKESPLMTEEELTDNLKQLLAQLIDKDTLECFGWPEEPVSAVLEKVLEHCGARVADRSKWSHVQCLRENTKHLFLYVIEDKNIARMLHTHTIDQTIKHILAQVTDTTTRTIIHTAIS